MIRGISGLALLIVLLAGAGAVALLLKLFWPKPSHAPDAADNWAQHNELRTPSVEQPAEAPYDNVERGYDIAFRGGDD